MGGALGTCTLFANVWDHLSLASSRPPASDVGPWECDAPCSPVWRQDLSNEVLSPAC